MSELKPLSPGKLAKFVSILSTQKTKDLVRAGAEGDDSFPQLFQEYKWNTTLDFNMAAIITAIFAYIAKKGDPSLKSSAKRVLNKKVAINGKQKTLPQILVKGDGKTITKEFKTDADFKAIMKKISDSEANDDFWARVKKITPWIINKKNVKILRATLENISQQDLSEDIDTEQVAQPESEPEPENKDKLKEVATQLQKYIKNNPPLLPDRIFVYYGSTSCGGRGWKLHISPKPMYLMDTIEVLEEVMKNYKFVQYKFVNSLENYMKHMSAGNQAGKFITIYPYSDEETKDIAEKLHEGLKKKGMTTDKYFISVKNDFKVYPGIYTRLCDYGDKISGNSRYRLGIPDKFLRILKSNGKEKKEHPFDKLSIDGIEMPKNLFEINTRIMDELISKSTWEPLTNKSQIPDNSEFECVVPHKAWAAGVSQYFFAIAKVQLPGHSDFKIVLVPKEVDLYCRITGYNEVKQKSEKLLPDLIKCLKQRKEVTRVKTVALTREEPKKENLCFVKNPINFLKGIQKKMKSWKEN